MVNMMTSEFAVKVAKEIENATGWFCEVRDMPKNNGNCTAITVRKNEDDTVGSTVYIPDRIASLTWDDLSEDDVNRMAREFIRAIENASPLGNDVSTTVRNIITDKLEVLRRVFFVLVSRKWNTNTEFVSRPVDGDLQYVYKIDVSNIVGENANIQLTKEHILRACITEEQLFDAAYNNTAEKYPAEIVDISEYLTGGYGLPEGLMYVVTNSKRLFGATGITYPSIVEKAKKYLGNDFVIIRLIFRPSATVPLR